PFGTLSRPALHRMGSARTSPLSLPPYSSTLSLLPLPLCISLPSPLLEQPAACCLAHKSPCSISACLSALSLFRSRLRNSRPSHLPPPLSDRTDSLTLLPPLFQTSPPAPYSLPPRCLSPALFSCPNSTPLAPASLAALTARSARPLSLVPL